MDTKITVIYDNPVEPAAFQAGYPEQVKLAQDMPGVQRVESAKVWRKEDGSPTPAYRLLDMYFTDYVAASAAVTTETAGQFFAIGIRAGDRRRPNQVRRSVRGDVTC